ncbi:hypothetical protein [Paenibacillus tepidiphilus]|uniref:hypothetical protein n=1 Tax=Paenibacillus tepidiphilus TaxID=2608683 RepID=UPI0013A560B1|nr:hypothetical protein [Paenibacillus tepidiphilus]
MEVIIGYFALYFSFPLAFLFMLLLLPERMSEGRRILASLCFAAMFWTLTGSIVLMAGG